MQVETLPFTSVTVTVTFTELVLNWPKLTPAAGFCVIEATPHASEATMPVITLGIEASQLGTVRGAGQLKVGGVTSRIVTEETHVAVLPDASVTNNVM
jgi:hypothetical protein